MTEFCGEMQGKFKVGLARLIRDFRSATAEDTASSLLLQVVANGWPEVKKDCHPFLLDYWTYREEISAENGLLFKATAS